jgi:hypothetical protein
MYLLCCSCSVLEEVALCNYLYVFMMCFAHVALIDGCTYLDFCIFRTLFDLISECRR